VTVRLQRLRPDAARGLGLQFSGFTKYEANLVSDETPLRPSL
jgi:hypothetical protein